MERNIWNVIGRMLSGEADNFDKELLNDWKLKNYDNQKSFNIISELWKSKQFSHKNLSTEKEFIELINKINNSNNPRINIATNTRKKIILNYFKYAAILIAGIFITKVFFTKPTLIPVTETSYTVHVPFGAKSKIDLPDGSKIWLNSVTTLRYSSNFNITNRDIQLEGEAFFDVAKNEDKLFVVKTNYMNVKVFGTTFNVRSYNDDNQVEATLVDGNITLEYLSADGNNTNELKLIKNEKAILLRNKDHLSLLEKPTNDVVNNGILAEMKQIAPSEIIINKKIDLEDEIAWKDMRLIFRDDPFSKISREMERWYDIKMHFENDEILNYKYRGMFENETIEQALEALKLTTPFEYKIIQRDVYISIKK